MELLKAVLMGLAASVDNTAVGVSLGVSVGGISAIFYIIMGAVAAAISYISAAFLKSCGEIVGVTAKIIGGAVLILIGTVGIIKEITDFGKVKSDEGKNIYGNITVINTFKLAVALSIDCIPISMSAGITGVPPYAIAISNGAFGALSVLAGVKFGEKGIKFPKEKARILSDVLLIGVGIAEIFV